MSAATLGSRVKAAREATGLSMRALPGVDHGVLSRIESGKVTDPGIATMDAIARATGKTVDELMGAPASAVRMVPLCDIEADPTNPRTVDVADSVDGEFVDSIRTQGLLQAVTVRRMPADHVTDHGGKPWRIAFGGRRYAALVLIHGPKSKQPVPALVLDTDEPSDLLLKQLVENVARADMNPADLAAAIATLVRADQDTAAIAKALKRGRRWVQEQASVGRWLTEESMRLLRGGTLNISQAVAIAAERDGEKQDKLATHASLQGLNEDEIRAIIADGKAKEATAQAKADADAQPALIEEEDDKNTDPVDHSKRLKWKGAHGHIVVQVFKLPNQEAYTHGGDSLWRPPGGYSWGWSANYVNYGGKNQRLRTWPTPWDALADAARKAFEAAVTRPGAKVDAPLLKLFTTWAAKQYRQIGGDEGGAKVLEVGLAELMFATFNPPVTVAPAPRAKAVPKLPPIDIDEPPKWAQPMVGALFMYHTGRQAFLCKGWRQMAKTFSQQMDADQEELRALYDRAAWANDTEGKPFDFGGAVVRLVDAPA